MLKRYLVLSALLLSLLSPALSLSNGLRADVPANIPPRPQAPNDEAEYRRFTLEARALLLNTDWEYWKEAILRDLERAHPDIRDCVSHIDIMRMGHAMIHPTVGFMFGQQRRAVTMATTSERVFFANSDLSGISIFEEAQYRGVEAAKQALRAIAR